MRKLSECLKIGTLAFEFIMRYIKSLPIIEFLKKWDDEKALNFCLFLKKQKYGQIKNVFPSNHCITIYKMGRKKRR